MKIQVTNFHVVMANVTNNGTSPIAYAIAYALSLPFYSVAVHGSVAFVDDKRYLLPDDIGTRVVPFTFELATKD